MSSVRDKVIERSGGRCEAMVELPRTWARCGRTPVEDHHMLTRARGGDVLDTVGEIYHHLALCNAHHRGVYDREAHGLRMEGQVWIEAGRVVYQGPDEYLSTKYPLQMPVVRDLVRRPLAGADARGAL